MLQQAHLNTVARFFNKLYLRPIGTKKASLLTAVSDWLALSALAVPGLSGSVQLGPLAGDAIVALQPLAFT